MFQHVSLAIRISQNKPGEWSLEEWLSVHEMQEQEDITSAINGNTMSSNLTHWSQMIASFSNKFYTLHNQIFLRQKQTSRSSAQHRLPDQFEQKTVQTDSARRLGSHQKENLRELQHHAHKQRAEISDM